jgi:hypothetical protein
MSDFDDLMSASLLELEPVSVPLIPQNDIIVFVSSRTFSIRPSLFEQVKHLPWSESGGYNHLNADPEHFETILRFFLAGSFPGRIIVKRNKEALSKLVSFLGDDANELKICIEQGGGARTGKNRNRIKRRGSNSCHGSAKTLSRSNSNSSLGSVKKLLQSPFKRKKAASDELLESAIAKLANPLSDDLSDPGAETTSSTFSNGSQKENLAGWSPGRLSCSKKRHQQWCEQSEFIV